MTRGLATGFCGRGERLRGAERGVDAAHIRRDRASPPWPRFEPATLTDALIDRIEAEHLRDSGYAAAQAELDRAVPARDALFEQIDAAPARTDRDRALKSAAEAIAA